MEFQLYDTRWTDRRHWDLKSCISAAKNCLSPSTSFNTNYPCSKEITDTAQSILTWLWPPHSSWLLGPQVTGSVASHHWAGQQRMSKKFRNVKLSSWQMEVVGSHLFLSIFGSDRSPRRGNLVSRSPPPCVCRSPPPSVIFQNFFAPPPGGGDQS